MQIKLIPATPLPTVLFTVTYSEPPDYLGFPASWAQALHRLSADDLELPGTVHAFDKTTWLVAVLHSVTFDLGRGIVVCAYVDGRTEGWALEEGEIEMMEEMVKEGGGEELIGGRRERRRRCREELESVLKDVSRSAVEAEREKRRAEVAQQQAQAAAAAIATAADASTTSTSSSPSSAATAGGKQKDKEGRDGKHKKQRSLLMSLVASLVSPSKHGHAAAHHAQNTNATVGHVPSVSSVSTVSSSTTTSTSSSTTTSTGVSASTAATTADDASSIAASTTASVIEEDEEHMSSTALRRRARSTLVNAFRRHVLARLSARQQPGGYAAWVARSMLGRVEGEMAQMVRDAGGAPDMDPSMGWVGGGGAVVGMGQVRGGKAPSDTGATRGTESVVASDGASGAALADEPPPFFEDVDVDGDTERDTNSDEDADRDSASTDTDGSSVHTPDTVSFDGSPFFAPPRCSSPPPSPPTPPTTPPALAPGSGSGAKYKASVQQQVQVPQQPPSMSPTKPKLRRQTIFAPRSAPSPPTTSHAQGHAHYTHAPHVHTPGRPNFSPCDLAAYTALSGQRLRLQSVLARIEAQLSMQAQDERQLQSVLEIKSRRRAWSNRQFMGSANVRFMGLGTPARSSPLARYEPVSANEREEAIVVGVSQKAVMGVVMEGMGMGGGKPKRGLVVTTAEHNIMRLFPVCEEDEEEDPAPPYQSTISVSPPPPPPPSDDVQEINEKDLPLAMPTVRLVEERSLPDADVVLPLPLQLQRHAVPIRQRTRGILQDEPTPALSPTTAYATDNEKLGLSVLEPQTKVELFDVYHSEDEDEDEPALGDVTIEMDGCGGKHSEFTLGVDIPEPFGMGIDGRRFDHEEWISVANASIPSR